MIRLVLVILIGHVDREPQLDLAHHVDLVLLVGQGFQVDHHFHSVQVLRELPVDLVHLVVH